jgi:exodeoxyribonuclease VII small subunit
MSRATRKGKEQGFETALARLEEIVKSLEDGDLALEESLRLFEEGVALTRQCAARLDEAQRRIEILTRGEGGSQELRPFDPVTEGDEGAAADRPGEDR